MRDKLLAIGWDVGGWMGNNHGFSIIQWNYDKKEYKWLGKSIELGIPAASTFSLEYIIEQVTDIQLQRNLLKL
ncbi:hypothetical protein LJ207_07335 [Halanaerobium sp. Z-7514]|uniref:Uncharacterized protein n=1 Tax=Halanaerobium polyolivorans TaxID=2886943 RepID=A0AAW4WZX5_9FIRM|nr:hypothetical protein [Halanaerobium polyolivorans]MCC3145134.1 hypothetical protein [Halanaerobium polyolivorans]